MRGLGVIVGLMAMAGVAANAQACDGASCGNIVVAAGGSPFDGSWSETITGESPQCAGTINTTFQIINGELVQAGSHGVIARNGAARGAAAGNGFTLTWTGRFTPRTAAGRYKRSDGCVGRWQAVKQ